MNSFFQLFCFVLRSFLSLIFIFCFPAYMFQFFHYLITGDEFIAFYFRARIFLEKLLENWEKLEVIIVQKQFGQETWKIQ